MQKQSNQWLIPVILAAGVAVALWFYWARMSAPPPEPAEAKPPVAEEPAAAVGPVHPLPEVVADKTDVPTLVPLPSLDQSDDYFKLEIAGIFGDAMEAMLVESGMIERLVATVDNLPRPHVAEKIRPVGRLSDPFLVDGQDASGEFTVNANNYRRYDELVNLISNADIAEVADLYRRYYPLFQKAYVNLGYPNGYFNDRLVEVIDHLLETPRVTGPTLLVRPHVLYEYQDPALERLSSGQKLMLRLGNEHADRIKATLRELRALVTAM
jgi:hypothetical protein